MPRTKGSKGKHNKEKPIKEKKKRGRPSKQHQKQHQQQKQIVNVNVNGGGGGGGGNKTTIPVPIQLPSTIYDPSLIAPRYGINDRQPVNPLTDAATDLMTPFIQSLISNQAQRVDRIPTNPINTKTPPISQGDVKPINPVISEPIPQYVPNPQTDQSHPIPPEIIMDSNIDSSIHNKHMHHKNLQNQIKPQVPKKPKKLINDTEGIGKIIPIQNVETIAGTVGTAALTGGASAAGEAFFAGGAAGLMNAGETILGASIGSGVAAGTSMALGNSHAANFISGTMGGLAGRAAGRAVANRLRNRNIENQELQPLIPPRTGGNRNRIVDNEIQVSRDPQTGEATNWQVPPEQTSSALLNRTARTLRNTAQNISDRVNNIRQQLTGRITNAGRGRYSRVATNEVHEPMEQSVQGQINEPPIQDITHEIMNPLHESATRIQRMSRAIRQRRRNADRQYQEQISREFDENIMRSRQEELQRNQDAMNELDQILRQDALNQVASNQSTAATTIQNALRGNRARNTSRTLNRERTINRMQTDIMAHGVVNDTVDNAVNQSTAATRIKTAAATKIQSALRNRNALNETIKRAEQKQEKGDAATKIQSAVRNRNATNEVIKRATQKQEKRDAATTIQRKVRENKLKKPVIISTEPPRPSTKPMIDFISDRVSKNVVKNSLDKIVKKQQTAAAATLQSAMRRKTDMMKKRQFVDEAKLQAMEETQRQIEAAKADTAKKMEIAASQLQARTKRVVAQSNIAKINKAKDTIGAAAKRLLTERATSTYSPTINKTVIWNKNTVGQPLAVSKRSKLVSKKRHNAAVFGYETRQDFLDLAKQYSGIMTKGK